MAVLVVDDDATVVNLVTAVLHRAGIEAEVALDGPGALARLGRGRYRAVLSDMTMPGMSGLQLVREARARGHEQPFLIMTAYVVPEAEALLRAEPGVAGVLRKPFDIKRLVDEVRALLAPPSAVAAPGVADVLAVSDELEFDFEIDLDGVDEHGDSAVHAAPQPAFAEMAATGTGAGALLPLTLMEWVTARLRRQALIAQAERRAAALRARATPPRRTTRQPVEREAEQGC